jgi:hypothetical protein
MKEVCFELDIVLAKYLKWLWLFLKLSVRGLLNLPEL